MFVTNLHNGHVTANIASTRKCIFALVLYESFPFHAFPNTRKAIDHLATAVAPEWPTLRPDVTFVPLSVQELEFALLIEQERGVLIEDQLEAYAQYREAAPFMVDYGGRPRFSLHFGDFINDRWATGLATKNQLLLRTWERFSGFLFQALASESITDYHRRCQERWIKEAAYFRWENGGRKEGTHLSDWFASVQEYEELEKALGMPPYRHTRMRQYDAISEKFTGLGPMH